MTTFCKNLLFRCLQQNIDYWYTKKKFPSPAKGWRQSRRNSGKSSLSIIIIIFVIPFLFSCETLFINSNKETDLTELNIKDIFTEDKLAIFCNLYAGTLNSALDTASGTAQGAAPNTAPGLQTKSLSPDYIYTVLEEMFFEADIRFFMSYNDDETMQEVLKEIAIIESAEKAYSFTIKKSEEITANRYMDIETIENLFILSFSVKQLLVNCVNNIDPLKEQIEEIIEEKRWDMEYQEEEDPELFFSILELENGISYLNKIKKTLSKNIIEISKTINKAENLLKQFNN